jgi:hypothetical protein
VLILKEPQIPPRFNMYLVNKKSTTVLILQKLSRHYLPNRSNSDIGIFGFIDGI